MSNRFDPSLSVQHNDTAEAPLRIGHHSDPGAHYDPHGICKETILPDMASVIDGLNGWTEAEDLPKAVERAVFEKAADILRAVLEYLTHPLEFLPTDGRCSVKKTEVLRQVGLRAVSAAIALRPTLLPEAYRTQGKLARAFCLPKQSISRQVKNLVQVAHGKYQHGKLVQGAAVRQMSSKRSLEVHRRLGHRIHNGTRPGRPKT